MHVIETILVNMDIVVALRICYLLWAVAILVIYAIPSLRDRFLAYGARITPAKSRKPPLQSQTLHDRLLNYVASVKISHSLFKHFYMLSVVSSMVWLQQLYTRGPIFQKVLSVRSPNMPSMSFNQLVLCWTLMMIQGSRRLYETMTFAKPSSSEMWMGHYILGLLFYLTMGVAIWVEGVPALSSTNRPLGDAIISAPSISTFIFLPVFLLASGIQHDAHSYLNSLREYTLPTHPAFASIISPHYTAECVIYLSFAFIAAPNGEVVNKTLLTALTFVVIELGVSADMTKDWYKRKYGGQLVESKWRMIPGIW